MISLLYPRRCPICDEVVPQGELIHRDCAANVQLVGPVTCVRCGKPLADPGEETCTDCRRKRHVYQRNLAVFRYRSVASSLYRFKYGGRQEYADYYAAVVEAAYGQALCQLQPDALIPVPLHPARQRQRGYNQAAVLAEAIGRRTGIPVEQAVRRVRNTIPMKELDEQGRRNNLENAFLIDRDGVEYKRVIVIDDIYTTGSTMDAVAMVLRGSGTQEVWGLTLSIGQV